MQNIILYFHGFSKKKKRKNFEKCSDFACCFIVQKKIYIKNVKNNNDCKAIDRNIAPHL